MYLNFLVHIWHTHHRPHTLSIKLTNSGKPNLSKRHLCLTRHQNLFVLHDHLAK